ncbi:MAG: hypothetical protein ACE5G7_05195 [Candidatus Hydrothermarchaeaceae archaeon]
MKRGILLLLVFYMIGNAGVAFAATDYLRATSSEVSPSTTARIDQPIVANVKLKGFTPYPEEATLDISVELARPRLEVIIDGEYQVYGLPEVEIPLPSEGVTDIEIRVSGFAPPVTKLTTIKVLDVKTRVRYKGENETTQDDGTLTLTISDKKIIETVTAIDDAWDEFNRIRLIIDSLKGKGVNTVELEAELQDIKAQINLAENAHNNGDIETAQLNADIALNSLDRLDDKAQQASRAGLAPTDIRRYLIIAGAVMVALLLVIFIRGRREELG